MLLFSFAHASAQLVPPCEALLAAISIPHTPQDPYAIEIAASGQAVEAGDPLPVLESGHYVYLIAKSGTILFSPRYHLTDEGFRLVTHKSLLAAYKNFKGRWLANEIVAAGEFQVAFDEVMEIRNKSGNFRGGGESLRLAVDVLKSHGLPITPRTRIRPVVPGAPEDRGHTPKDRELDAFRIEILQSVHGSERGRALLDLYQRMYFLTRETFPLARARDAVEALMNAQAAGAGESGLYDGYQTFYYPLQMAFTVDGLEYGIAAVEMQAERGGPDGFAPGVPKQIENFRYGAQDRLNPALSASWSRLAEEFRRLDELKN